MKWYSDSALGNDASPAVNKDRGTPAHSKVPLVSFVVMGRGRKSFEFWVTGWSSQVTALEDMVFAPVVCLKWCQLPTNPLDASPDPLGLSPGFTRLQCVEHGQYQM